MERRRRQETILSSVISLLLEQPLSIAEIQRKINIKRSTLIYYLNQLEAKGIIEKNRLETKKTGRPTMISLRKEKRQQMVEGEERKKEKIKEVLKKLKEKGEVPLEEFVDFLPPGKWGSGEWRENMGILLDLENSSYVYKLFKITERGEQFLKENPK